jgi:hypothetical protein
MRTGSELFSNRLTGIIPASLGNLSQLQQLCATAQTCAAPDCVGSGLFKNQLTGSIPVELGNLLQLQILCALHSRLGGTALIVMLAASCTTTN